MLDFEQTGLHWVTDSRWVTYSRHWSSARCILSQTKRFLSY
jgi:hypothetical protein